MATTPNGVLIQEGYESDNPYDTGRSGERNFELWGGVDTQEGWDYDAGKPKPGAVKVNGRWVMPGGSSGGGTGGLPDFNTLMRMAQGSPFWQQAEDARRAADAAELASIQEGARRGVIGWGEELQLPDAWSKYNLLNDQTLALAKQNTQAGLSTLARLRESRDVNIRDLVRSLSARGMRRSGSRLYGMNKANLGYERTSTDARNALLAQIAQSLGAYSNNAYGRMMANNSLMANIMNMFNMSRSTGGGGGSPSNPPYNPPARTDAGITINGINAPTGTPYNPGSGYFEQPTGSGGRWILD